MNPLSAIYGFAVARRNRRYDTGAAEIARAGVPVVSVGNISVGGTGKTPFVQYVVRELLALGRRPAVVSRGYGRRSKGEVVVSDGSSILASVEQSGDELMLHAEHLPVPVIANADRVAGAQTARRLGADAIVLDDGFQHRRLFRDCDIVLVDNATLQQPVLLPVGRLREPLQSLLRADVLCGVGGVACADIPPQYKGQGSVCIEAIASSGECRDAFTRAPVDVRGHRLVAFAGIAKPERFFSSPALRESVIAEQIAFSDHRDYREKDVSFVVGKCAALGCAMAVTTEKDAVKLRRFLNEFTASGVQLVVLPVEMQITAGAEQLRQKLSSLFTMENR